ncbi:hypothetical protein Plhal304r1_c008g0034341 [Plasmopara halstedii]
MTTISQPQSTNIIDIPTEPDVSAREGGSSPALTTKSGHCSRGLQRRFSQFRRCLVRMSIGLPISRGTSGLTMIMTLLMIGIVGTFALHQMMSPEIETLTQQRETLKDEVMVFRLKLENMTRVAESRLETIHLLETELERQHVQAAEAAATATIKAEHSISSSKAMESLDNDDLRSSAVLSMVLYTLLLGSVVLASVLYRIYFIIRGEISARYKLGKREYIDKIGIGGPIMPSITDSSMDGKQIIRETPPLPPARTPISDKAVTNGGRLAGSGCGSTSLSPTPAGAPAPQCYKRAPGLSPTIV